MFFAERIKCPVLSYMYQGTEVYTRGRASRLTRLVGAARHTSHTTLVLARPGHGTLVATQLSSVITKVKHTPVSVLLDQLSLCLSQCTHGKTCEQTGAGNLFTGISRLTNLVICTNPMMV